MDERLKHRLVGAAVLVLAAVIFVPMLLQEDDEPPASGPRWLPSQPLEDGDARVVPLDGGATAPDSGPALPASAPASSPEPVASKPAQPPAAKAVSPPPAKAPAPAPVVGSATKFAVQLGSFSKADNAEGLRDTLRAKGYTAFTKSAGAVTRVYVGPQPSRAEAEKALARLLADTKLKGIVVEYSG
jgi:DedD protein